jgi:hypothetical protein
MERKTGRVCACVAVGWSVSHLTDCISMLHMRTILAAYAVKIGHTLFISIHNFHSVHLYSMLLEYTRSSLCA